MKAVGCLGFLLVVNVTTLAQAEILRVECNPSDKPVVRLIEIDTSKNQVRFWAKFQTFTNGPFGPYAADITADKMIWMEVTKKGNAVSTTRYVIDRKKRTLDTDITYSWDQDPWHETAPCK